MLVNDTIASENAYSVSPLSAEAVLAAIDNGRSEGGPVGQHWVLDPIDGTKGYVGLRKLFEVVRFCFIPLNS